MTGTVRDEALEQKPALLRLATRMHARVLTIDRLEKRLELANAHLAAMDPAIAKEGCTIDEVLGVMLQMQGKGGVVGQDEHVAVTVLG